MGANSPYAGCIIVEELVELVDYPINYDAYTDTRTPIA